MRPSALSGSRETQRDRSPSRAASTATLSSLPPTVASRLDAWSSRCEAGGENRIIASPNVTRSMLPDLPSRRDLPPSVHSAAPPVRDFVVQVHRRATVARHHPDFLADFGGTIDLHVAVLLIHLSHGPAVPDKVAERADIEGLIARKRL